MQLSLGQRLTPLINGVAAHVHIRIAEAVAVDFRHPVQNQHSLLYDLRADAVAANQRNVFLHSLSLL